MRRLRTCRRGISLLEVMLATTLLLACVMALSRLAFLARRHATGAEDRTGAQIHCQNIMQEILAGARPLQNVSPQPFEGDQWIYSVDIQPVGSAPLLAITVTVDRLEEEDDVLLAKSELSGYRLVRWVRSSERSFDESEDPSWEMMEENSSNAGARPIRSARPITSGGANAPAPPDAPAPPNWLSPRR